MIFSFFKVLYAVFASLLVGIIDLIAIPFDRKGHIFHLLSHFHSRTILAVCGVKVVVQGLEHLDHTKSYIYVSNHASMFDIPAVIAGIPDEIRIMFKKELGRIPLWGWGLKLSKIYIEVDRGKGHDAIRSLDDAAEKMRGGSSVLLFAEGTRTTDGKLQPFKRGAFYLAIRSGFQVVPLTINGSYGILQKHSIKIKPGTITLILDKPIDPPQADGKEAESQLREEVQRIIQGHYIEQ
ncbi:MAG: lysophospholipid acyltransferase family protein [Bacteroidota bacterium]